MSPLRPLACCVLLLFSMPAHAESISEINKDLKAVEKNLQENEGAAQDLSSTLQSTKAELKKLSSDTKALANKVKDAETNTAKLRRKLDELKAEQAALEERRDTLKKNITPMLRAGLDMARKPADLHVFFDDPENADRLLTGQVAMRGTARQMQGLLDQYALTMEELKAVEEKVAREEAELSGRVEALSSDRKELTAHLKEREKLAKTTEGQLAEKQETIKALAKKREGLSNLLASLKREEAERRAARQRQKTAHKSSKSSGEAAKKKSAPTLARGLPASGYVVQHFGEADEDSGLAARGITIEGESGGLVTAPRNGEVRFNGPFKGFGNLVILEHDNGDFSLLGGLGRASVREGEKVAKGSPVGTLSASTSPRPRLYYELRRGGSTPVDPM